MYKIVFVGKMSTIKYIIRYLNTNVMPIAAIKTKYEKKFLFWQIIFPVWHEGNYNYKINIAKKIILTVNSKVTARALSLNRFLLCNSMAAALGQFWVTYLYLN